MFVVCDWPRKRNKLKDAFFVQSQTTNIAVIYATREESVTFALANNLRREAEDFKNQESKKQFTPELRI